MPNGTLRRHAFAPAALITLLIATASSPHAQNGAPPQAQTPANPAAPATPDSLGIGRDRVVAPRARSQVTPEYTPEAMRARIQGSVSLRGIVELDGTISGIEVVKSLDQTYGLDQAAVDALRQWRFEPGTVDGSPVRIAITVNLNFALGGSPPVQAWPNGFTAAASPAGTVEETAGDLGMQLKITRPANWAVVSGAPREWLVIRSERNDKRISVLRPEGASFDLQWPVPEPLVARVGESMRKGQSSGAEAVVLETGQIQAARVFWVWTALRLPTLPNSPGVTPGTNPFSEARTWMFLHTLEGRVVAVSCTALIPRGLDSAAIDAWVKQAAEEFAPIVNSIVFEVGP